MEPAGLRSKRCQCLLSYGHNMAVKMTFSLDEATADRLQRTSEALRKPKSEIVREAIQDYAERVGKLSEA